MREEDVAGVAHLVLGGRAGVVALRPKEKGLGIIALRYGVEARKPELP